MINVQFQYQQRQWYYQDQSEEVVLFDSRWPAPTAINGKGTNGYRLRIEDRRKRQDSQGSSDIRYYDWAQSESPARSNVQAVEWRRAKTTLYRTWDGLQSQYFLLGRTHNGARRSDSFPVRVVAKGFGPSESHGCLYDTPTIFGHVQIVRSHLCAVCWQLCVPGVAGCTCRLSVAYQREMSHKLQSSRLQWVYAEYQPPDRLIYLSRGDCSYNKTVSTLALPRSSRQSSSCVTLTQV